MNSRTAARLAIPAALVSFLLVLRPGVVLNALRSPVAWTVMAGVLLLGASVRALALRCGRSQRVAGVVSAIVVALCVTALLAPSFRQRTLVEALPAPATAPVAATVGDAAPAPAPSADRTAPLPAPTTTAAPDTAPDAAPDAAPAPAQAAAAPPAEPPLPPAAAPAPATAAAAAPAPGTTGELMGIGHRARGTVDLREVDGKAYVIFREVDIEGTVDPSVHLVPPGARTPRDGVRLGALKAERGTFSYELPAGTDLTRSWSVLVWCDPYDTPIAAADPR